MIYVAFFLDFFIDITLRHDDIKEDLTSDLWWKHELTRRSQPQICSFLSSPCLHPVHFGQPHHTRARLPDSEFNLISFYSLQMQLFFKILRSNLELPSRRMNCGNSNLQSKLPIEIGTLEFDSDWDCSNKPRPFPCHLVNWKFLLGPIWFSLGDHPCRLTETKHFLKNVSCQFEASPLVMRPTFFSCIFGDCSQAT